MGIKVIPKRLGYYDHKRRYPNDHPKWAGPFELLEGDKPGRWMEVVEGDAPIIQKRLEEKQSLKSEQKKL